LLHDNAPPYTSLFTREFWTKPWLSSPTHPTFLFPRLKIELKGRHFDVNKVFEAKLQAVLNNLTEHDFRVEFKKMAEMLGTVHTYGRGLLRG
jgi:hypothetical protein